MQLLISCAKTMTGHPVLPASMPRPTAPRYEDTAGELAARMVAVPAAELAGMLHTTPRIAAENRRRYLAFHDPGTPSLPAVLAYNGIVFKRIGPESLTEADFAFAQRHLNITSYLYGLLRPLDAIRPYRLEGGVQLPGTDGGTLFDFWRKRLTDDLLARLRSDDGMLLNLASGEMKRLFDWKTICREARVISPEFRIREGEGLKTVVVYTKMCRGEMTRHFIRQRIADPERLKEFEWEGFRFDDALSCGDEWVFTM